MGELVSIIVPVYNCEKYLKRCLSSLVHQSYKDIEILVINDGSTDNSQLIIDKMAQMDSRIRAICQVNQGVAAARNCALSCAKGTYYLFVDGDDYVGTDYVKDLVQCANTNQSELVVCGYTLIYEGGGKKKRIIPSIYIKNEKEEWAYRISSVWGRLYKSQFWNENNLCFITEKNARAEDVPIALFSNIMAKNVCVISKSDYFYVQHEGSAMHGKGKVKFLFPYIAFKEMYNKVQYSDVVNSKAFFNIGILKFLAQFEYVLYSKADKVEKERFHRYVSNLLKNDFKQMEQEWYSKKKVIDFPLTHKVAISLFCRKIGKYID